MPVNLSPGVFHTLSSGARDGHEFILQAGHGAVAALVEHVSDSALRNCTSPTVCWPWKPSRRRSAGVSESCHRDYRQLWQNLDEGNVAAGDGGRAGHATAGWNNRIGVPMTLFGLDADKHCAAVIEAGINQPGEMAHLGAMIGADCVILTNIGPAHLELLKNVDNVASEKVQLLVHAQAKAPLILPNAAYQLPALAACAERAIVLAQDNETVSPEPKQIVRYRLNGRQLRLEDKSYRIESSSTGICLNAALAIVAGRVLGRSDGQIAMIEDWQPDASRGRIASKGGQTFYIDCYNANPTSMLDALNAFIDAVPVGLPRCYVLGAMNELGADAQRLHREVAAALKLRQRDRVCLVGPEHLTAAYCEGLNVAPEQIRAVETIDKLDSVITPFTGAIFLKGSRSYALEKLLPESLRIS